MIRIPAALSSEPGGTGQGRYRRAAANWWV